MQCTGSQQGLRLCYCAGIFYGASYSMGLKTNGAMVEWGWQDFTIFGPKPGRKLAAVSAGDRHAIGILAKTDWSKLSDSHQSVSGHFTENVRFGPGCAFAHNPATFA